MAGLLVDLVETDFFGIGSGGIQSDREVTSERRKKPFQLARGAIGYSKRNRGTPVFKTNWEHSFRQPILKKNHLRNCSSLFSSWCSGNRRNKRRPVMKWYDANANNPPWIKALADVRRMGTLEGYCFHHVQAIMIAIDQYAETALGTREYFLNRPHSIGGMNDKIP
jgi:hypothetical protein